MDCSITADTFFGPRITPCRRQFDFTLAFEHWILVLVPELCFVVCGTARWLWLSHTARKVLPTHQNHGLATAKLVATGCLLALKVASLAAWALAGRPTTMAAVVSSSASFVSAVILIPLSHHEHKRTMRPSSLVCLYLLATVIIEAAQVRTLWFLQPFNLILAAVATTSLAVRALLLPLEAAEKGAYITSEHDKVSPESTSSILNRSVYWWINGLFFQGFRSELNLQSLYNLDENLASKALTSNLVQRFDADTPQRLQRYELLRHSVSNAKWSIVRAVVARALVIPLKYAQPFLFSDLIERVSAPDQQDQEAAKYGMLGAMLVVYTLLAATNATYKRQTIQMMTIIRGSLVGAIYAQTLMVKSQLTGTASSANALTFMSTDVDRIVVGVQNIHEMWAASFEIVIAFTLLVLRIGYPSVAGLVVAVACIVGSSYIAPRMRQTQRLWVQAVQERVNFTAGILKAMRQVKMLGIESAITDKIHRFRELELSASKPFRLLIVAVNVLNAGATSIAPAATIILYTATRMNLHTDIPQPDDIFTSLSLISLLTGSVTLLSLSLTKFTSGLGSFDRIQSYLLTEVTKAEVSDDETCQSVEAARNTGPELTPLSEGELVIVRNGSFQYGKDSKRQLSRLTFTVNRNETVAVTGSLSCGKSTLLKAVLGEVALAGGQLSVQATRVGYCQQVPYILNDTIRSNIVGDAHVDAAWLEEVIISCDLAVDIDCLSSGLDTVVGTSGLQLSGGQKQRLALARTVYAKPELLLLDDVFSALDAITASRIFQRLFSPEGLIKQLGSGVVIVTADADQLSYADKVILLSETGCIDAQGRYADIAKCHGFPERSGDFRNITKDSQTEPKPDIAMNTSRPGVAQTSETPTAKRRGSGDFSLYGYYINSIGWLVFLCLLGFAILYVMSLVLPQILLSWWSSSVPEKGVTYLVTYTVVSVISVLAIGLYIGYFFVWAVPRSAIKLHRLLLDTVMDMPWVRLVQIEAGSLINRFSQDMSLVDMQLPVAFGITLQMLLTCLAQGVMIAVGSGYMSAVIPLCIVVLYAIQSFYLRTSRQIRLLGIEAKAPLYDHFLQTIDGGPTIRAFGWQERFTETAEKLLDLSQKPFYALYSVQQWLQVVLDLLVAALATLLTALVLFVTNKSTSGAVGVALVNLLSFNTSLAQLITYWMQLETSLGAISRTKEFVTNQDYQPAQPTPDGALGQVLPANKVEFCNVSASYSIEDQLVLKDVSLRFEAGQRVGICGRTGSGKSTLLSCFFSLVNITSGGVYIDGIDIASISKERLRDAIVMIPQQPLLISGTVRENLLLGSPSPSTDEDIVSVLKKLRVWPRIDGHGGLDAEIDTVSLTESQKQLVCIGRALLQPGRIVILDEPTSGFDDETGRRAQELIREVFKGRLMLSVAHKIHTIMDSDVVVVMDNGRVAEAGPPPQLLQAKGAFCDLSEASSR